MCIHSGASQLWRKQINRLNFTIKIEKYQQVWCGSNGPESRSAVAPFHTSIIIWICTMCAHTGRARCLATFAAGPTTRRNRVLRRKNTPALLQNSVVLRVDYHMIVCDLNFCLQIRGDGPAATTTCWVTRSRRHRHHHLRFNWFESVQWGRFYPVESAKKLHNTDSCSFSCRKFSALDTFTICAMPPPTTTITTIPAGASNALSREH